MPSERLHNPQGLIESMNVDLSSLSNEMWDLNHRKTAIETLLAECDMQFKRIRDRVDGTEDIMPSQRRYTPQNPIESTNVRLSRLSNEMWDLNHRKTAIEARLAERDMLFQRIRDRVREVTAIRDRELGRYA